MSFWIWSWASFATSSLKSLPFFFTESLAFLRVLRTATFASSPTAFASFATSFRRSSVSCGMLRRMISPSLFGVIPKLASSNAASTSPNVLLSKGLTTNCVPLATEMDASWFKGVSAP